MLSGELARLSGVSPDTIRFYERKGLLPLANRSEKGYRHYSTDALPRVRLIQSALALGFTINELSVILQIRNQGGKPCHKVQQMAHEKLQRIETMIRDLKLVRKDLRSCLEDWDRELSNVPEGKQALLLEKHSEKNWKQKKSPLWIPSGLKKKRRPGS